MNIRIGLFLCLFIHIVLQAQRHQAKVIGEKDGDTKEILWEGKGKSVRLAPVDCPEKKQAFGMRAKEFVSRFCYGKTVEIIISSKPDRYGRWIAEIFYNNQNLNKELIRNGLAWHFKKYSKDEVYAELEKIARGKRLGLWQEQHPIAPWEWRKNKKDQRKVGL